MKSESNDTIQCTIEEQKAAVLNAGEPRPLYGVFLFSGQGQLRVDFADYDRDGPTVLFTTPWQVFQIDTKTDCAVRALWFHADYYCIEAHKKEVACNVLLGRRVWITPTG